MNQQKGNRARESEIDQLEFSDNEITDDPSVFSEKLADSYIDKVKATIEEYYKGQLALKLTEEEK